MRSIPILLAALLAPACLAQGSGLTLSQALSLSNPPAAPASAASAPLSLEESRRLALEGQPQLARLAARVREAREAAIAEGQLPDPRLTLGLANLPVDSLSFTREDMTQAMLGISQMVPGGDKLRLAGRRMELEAARSEAELAATRLRIGREVAQAWLNLYAPRQALELVGRIGAEFDREVEWSAVAYAAGGLGQADTLALRAMREYVLDRQAQLQRDEARARVELGRWVGEAASRPPLAEGLPKPPQLEARGWEAALEGHPELAMRELGVQIARIEADLARESYKPDWSVDLSYGLRSGGRTDMVSLQLGVELPVFTRNRQDRRLAARLAGVEAAEDELQDRRRELAAGLGMALAELQAAERRIHHFESTLIPLAQRRVESAFAAYRTGQAPFSTVLEARRAELEARLQLLEQQVARARAAVDLRYYLGEEGTPGARSAVKEGS